MIGRVGQAAFFLAGGLVLVVAVAAVRSLGQLTVGASDLAAREAVAAGAVALGLAMSLARRATDDPSTRCVVTYIALPLIGLALWGDHLPKRPHLRSGLGVGPKGAEGTGVRSFCLE